MRGEAQHHLPRYAVQKRSLSEHVVEQVHALLGSCMKLFLGLQVEAGREARQNDGSHRPAFQRLANLAERDTRSSEQKVLDESRQLLGKLKVLERVKRRRRAGHHPPSKVRRRYARLRDLPGRNNTTYTQKGQPSSSTRISYTQTMQSQHTTLDLRNPGRVGKVAHDD